MNTQPQLLPRETRSVEFTVSGEPVPTPRPRGRRTETKSGKEFTQVYTPRDAKIRQWELYVRSAYEKQPAFSRPPFDGPLRVAVTFYLARPKNRMGRAYPDGPIPHTSTPDVDNLIKAVCDALNTIAWNDDRQICDMHGEKYYHEKTGRPRAEIRIEEL